MVSTRPQLASPAGRLTLQAPLPGFTILQTDITLPSTIPLVLSALGGRKADLVVCDGAPDGAHVSCFLLG